jgi:hypothetical protein
MWTTFLGKHNKPSFAEIVLALIPSRICNYQFCNRLDSLTLCNTRTVTFKLVAVKNRCLWFTQLYICASYPLFVFVNCCAFIRPLLFVHLFCSFVRLFCFIFIWVLLIVVQKRKRTILTLNSVQVFWSRCTRSTRVTCNTTSTCYLFTTII